MFACVIGGMLAVEWIRRARAGQGTSFVRVALLVVGGAALIGAPAIVADSVAFANRTGVPPLLYDSTLDVAGFAKRQLSRMFGFASYEHPTYTGWALLWLTPLLLGAVTTLRNPPDRVLPIYVGTSLLVVLIIVVSPVSLLVEPVLGPRYVARFIQLAPLPALAGLGLAMAATLRGRAVTVAGAVAIALCLAGLLRGIEPWRPAPIGGKLPVLERPELTRLAPIVEGRVVLADPDTAYILPHYTGAYVAWNVQGHANPFLFEPERPRGARALLEGHWRGERLLAWNPPESWISIGIPGAWGGLTG